MAFTISQNPKPAETPVAELPKVMTPETPGVLPIEALPVVEPAPQTAEERKAGDLQAAEALKATIVGEIAPAQSAEAKKQDFEKKIDSILEAGLKKVYTDLPPDVKEKFKTQGERTTLAVKALLESEKANAELITDLVRKWLKLIPANGNYFLEQEVKIKTDQLLTLAKKLHP